MERFGCQLVSTARSLDYARDDSVVVKRDSKLQAPVITDFALILNARDSPTTTLSPPQLCHDHNSVIPSEADPELANGSAKSRDLLFGWSRHSHNRVSRPVWSLP